MRPTRPHLALAILIVLAAAAVAATASDCPTRENITYALDTGSLDNPSSSPAVVFSQTVSFPMVAWMRVHFADASLPEGSFVRMTAALDGSTQSLDADRLAEWLLASAYFNGDAVLLELVAGPETNGNRLVADHVEVQFGGAPPGGPCHVDDQGVVGDDDRVLADEMWTGRTMYGACTASIYNQESCAVTAGHCCDAAEVLQFNVPLSHDNCVIVHPPAADQFPVTGRSGLPMPDFGVLTVGANHLGEKPYDRYGVLRPLASEPAAASEVLELWGYSTNNDNPTWNRVQQYSSGTVHGVNDVFIYHDTDVTWGGSGAAVLRDGEIVGVQSSVDGGMTNNAIRIDVPDFVSARETLCPAAVGVEQVEAPALTVRNHPNPFNPATEIRFRLGTSGAVDLGIFDPSGRLVRTLVAGRRFAAGVNTVRWDGRADDGSASPAGVYVYRLRCAGEVATGKMALLN